MWKSLILIKERKKRFRGVILGQKSTQNHPSQWMKKWRKLG
jgi:hypothetical protein